MNPDNYDLKWVQNADGTWAGVKIDKASKRVCDVLLMLSEKEYFLSKLAGKLDWMLQEKDIEEYWGPWAGI